jgi:hypothetical protein
VDLGNTNDIGFNVSGTGRLNATVSSGTWLVEVLYRALGSGVVNQTPTPTTTPTPSATSTPTPSATSTPTPTPSATVYMFTFDGTVGGTDFNVACSAYPIGSNSACYSYSPTIQVGTALYSTNTNGTLSNPFVDNGNMKLVVDGTTIYAIKTTTGGVITDVQECTAPTYTIGQTALGGKIAYILQSGDTGYDMNIQHGLVVSPVDLATGAAWGCQGTTISGADGTSIGTGNQNTIDIISECSSSGIAAKLCSDLSYGGRSDWYLPSVDELHTLFFNQNTIGGFSAVNYWSSTESSSDTALAIYFPNGFQGSGNKNDTQIYVRAVRSF